MSVARYSANTIRLSLGLRIHRDLLRMLAGIQSTQESQAAIERPLAESFAAESEYRMLSDFESLSLRVSESFKRSN